MNDEGVRGLLGSQPWYLVALSLLGAFGFVGVLITLAWNVSMAACFGLPALSVEGGMGIEFLALLIVGAIYGLKEG